MEITSVIENVLFFNERLFCDYLVDQLSIEAVISQINTRYIIANFISLKYNGEVSVDDFVLLNKWLNEIKHVSININTNTYIIDIESEYDIVCINT